MRKRLSLTLAALLFIALSIQSDAINRHAIAVAQDRSIPAPEDVLGFRPGDDRKLASWAKIVEYFQKLDASSDRVKFEEIGKTTMGAPYVFATISAPENLKRLDEFKEIQRQLADPRTLGSPRNPALADRRARALIARGKTVIAITCGIHSTEVGSTLSSTLIAHRLASSNEPEIQEILRNTIVLLVPSTNPDGVDIVKNWYDKTLGTPYEGTDPPELYHKYVGHDNNRDWYAFTQVETQLAVDKIMNVWHPHIVHDIHQQGALGSRLFLPPYMPPVEPNVPKQIIEGYSQLGNYMAGEMRKAGFQGITTNSTYDAWTPARAYSHYHAGVRILSETASARLATPLTVKFDQLNSREGYDPKKESANFGPVWRGGEWRLRDITNTMTTAAFFLLKHSAQNREAWLQRFYEIGKEAVRPRKNGEVAAYVLPRSGDASKNLRRFHLAAILARAGVEMTVLDDRGRTARAEDLLLQAFPKRLSKASAVTLVIPTSQPYSAFVRALLEPLRYPDLRDSAGHPIAPYDVTAHSVPLLMNVDVQPMNHPFRLRDIKISQVPMVFQATGFSHSRVALYKSHLVSMDEGWTRWLLEQNPEVKGFASVIDQDIRSASLPDKFDAIVIPDQSPSAILNGHRSGAMPPEYTGGLGAEGVKALREFVEQGGTLVCLNRASDFAIEQFKLPIRNVVDGLPRTEFFVPGSILRIELDTSDPMTKGMPRESIAWVENSPVFEIIAGARGSSPTVREGSDAGRMPALPVKIIARYPANKDPLLSGWLLGGDRIKGKAALVEVGMGKGRIILFGFRPQYRGQSLATYPLFFNAITNR